MKIELRDPFGVPIGHVTFIEEQLSSGPTSAEIMAEIMEAANISNYSLSFTLPKQNNALPYLFVFSTDKGVTS